MVTSKQSAEMDEIWSLFAQEGKENLLLAEEALLKLEQVPDDLDQIKALFRAIHSFKGGARMMGLGVVESLAHHAEDLMALIRDNGVTLQSDMIDLLLAVTDQLRAMLDQIIKAGHDVAPDQVAGLVEELSQIIASHQPTTQRELTSRIAVSTVSVPPIEIEPMAEPAQAETRIATEPIPSSDSASVSKMNWLVSAHPGEIAEFLKITENGLSQLHLALDAFANGSLEACSQIQCVANDLKIAADQLGYGRLVSLLDDLAREAIAGGQIDAATNDKDQSLLQLKKIELEIFEELTQIQDHGASPESPAVNNWTDIAWLFRHWNAERVYADLARLSEIADTLEQLTHQLTLQVSVSRQDERLAEEATILLRAIYHSSIFYHLDQAVHLTLALQDIYARIAQGELVANQVLTRLTREYVTNLGSTIDIVREGEIPELDAFANLIEQAQNFLYFHADGPVFEVTRSVLDVLDLPADFKQVMTPETMTQFSRALQAGEHFYTILADLEQDEALGSAFLDWSHSDGIRLITNVTVYRYNRTLFNFLFATIHTQETVRGSLAKMDPEWQYLTLRECSLRPEIDPQKPLADQAEPGAQLETESSARGGMASSKVLDNLIDTVGAMMADHATLHRVTERLADTDLAETVLRIAQGTNGNWEQTRHELQRYLEEWTEGIRTVGQVETQMGVALGQLQESARSLRRAPVSEMLNPLRRMVQELTSRQGRLVELDLQGTELELDRDTIQVLAEPIRRLVWFAVTQGIEDVERRRAVGKSSTGRVMVKVSSHEDHAQVNVEDDGCGLDRESILQRAHELDWVSQTATEELDFVLRPGFGLISAHDQAEGIDLAAIGSALRAHQGQLKLTSVAGKGTRFEIRLPLDMAVVDGMVVRVGDVRYVMPVTAIRRIVKPEAANLVHSSAEGSQSLLRFEEEIVPVRPLTGQTNGQGEYTLLMIIEDEQKRVALPIDELIGRQQVLVRPLQGQLADVQDVSGCALLGEGEVGMVLRTSFGSYQRAGGING